MDWGDLLISGSVHRYVVIPVAIPKNTQLSQTQPGPSEFVLTVLHSESGSAMLSPTFLNFSIDGTPRISQSEMIFCICLTCLAKDLQSQDSLGPGMRNVCVCQSQAFAD